MNVMPRLWQTLSVFCLGLGCAALTCTSAPAAEPVKIAIVEVGSPSAFHFTPATRKVKSGDILHWINLTSEEHTITPDEGFEDKLKGTDSIAPDDAESTQDEHFEVINADVGQITYHCEIHPEMIGTIDVGP